MALLRRLFGLCQLVLGALGLLAAAALWSGDVRAGAAFVGLLGAVGVYSGSRRLRAETPRPATRDKSSPRGAASSRRAAGAKYDQFRWGDPPPTRKQFGYAVSLGVAPRDGMTKESISEAIDDALDAAQPAAAEQLRLIKEYHGVLPRQINRAEANRVIEFLEDHCLACPFCRIQIFASDDFCCACERSLKQLRIPIQLD